VREYVAGIASGATPLLDGPQPAEPQDVTLSLTPVGPHAFGQGEQNHHCCNREQEARRPGRCKGWPSKRLKHDFLPRSEATACLTRCSHKPLEIFSFGDDGEAVGADGQAARKV
jgi:hypothetical protein